jgi:lipopolysaccharide/colanic/teichoic acid biosynthesis glycosyltransferase
MARIEQGISIPDKIDLSVDPDLIKRVDNLLGTEDNPDRSRAYLHGPTKAIFERGLATFILATAGWPALSLAYLGVLAADGRPLTHQEPVALLGSRGLRVNPVTITKVRSLERGVHEQETLPFSATAFRGGRERAQTEPIDPRVHSWVGTLLRKTGVDEIPQLKGVIEGEMALIGPRAFTLRELVDLEKLIDHLKETGKLRDFGFENYQETITRVAPLPGIFGLYAATLKKDLTVVERLILDYRYCLRASFKGDIRILRASIEPTILMVGAR